MGSHWIGFIDRQEPRIGILFHQSEKYRYRVDMLTTDSMFFVWWSWPPALNHGWIPEKCSVMLVGWNGFMDHRVLD